MVDTYSPAVLKGYKRHLVNTSSPAVAEVWTLAIAPLT